MLRFILDALGTLLVLTYLYVRGASVTTTSETDSKFTYTHENGNTKYVFLSQQFKHVTTYSRWFIRTKTDYGYMVEVIKYVNNTATAAMVQGYPHLCSPYLVNTTFPHRIAIAACIAELTRMEKKEGQ